MIPRSIQNRYIASACTMVGTMIGVSMKVRTASEVLLASRQQPMAHSVPSTSAATVENRWRRSPGCRSVADSQISFSKNAA